MGRNILLLEPNYKNKYPPIGLMKISTYHKMIGDNVVFYKGPLNELVIKQTTELCIDKFNNIDSTINWRRQYLSIFNYIKTRNSEFLKQCGFISSRYEILLLNAINYFKDYYWKGLYRQDPFWDRICITTLFTFHWDITVETINFAKLLVKDIDELWVGGVLATVLHKELSDKVGLKNVFKGQLNSPGVLDSNNYIIENLPLDYSILEEIDYKYPENNAYYGYMTRGCIRKCKFCAVPKLEPTYIDYLPLANKISEVSKVYGEKRNLLLLDNNVLASNCFPEIIRDIKKNGFTTGSKFIEPNKLEISINNLRAGVNDRAYIKKTVELLIETFERLKGIEQQEFFEILKNYHLLRYETAEKEDILLHSLYFIEKHDKIRNKTAKYRYVDFNQGIDARKVNEANIKLLSQIPIRPMRIAFDDIKQEKSYVKAVLLAQQYGIRHFSNYLLYNFNDHPIDLYHRLRINIELCEKHDLNIYSFPMKYHPISGDQYLNRDFIGNNWNRKFIRAIQVILNATKGTIGRGKSFFFKAFGKNDNEFLELMLMPDVYLLYRYFFQWNGKVNEWREMLYNELTVKERERAIQIIEGNDFRNIEKYTHNKKLLRFFQHYQVTREMIHGEKNDLYRQKAIFDSLPDSEKYDFYKS